MSNENDIEKQKLALLSSKRTHFEQKTEDKTSSWSHAVKSHLNNIYHQNSLAREIASTMFFSLESWPSYMVELFVLNNIANYTYSMRNKICLFFWGNGGTVEDMFTLSELFAPKIANTYEQQRALNENQRKCIGLFQTYNEQRSNPHYGGNYYFYSMIENRMLFIDGSARHFGKKQANKSNFRFR